MPGLDRQGHRKFCKWRTPVSSVHVGGLVTYTRGDKESHLDTIGYEIDMLRFCLKYLNDHPGFCEKGESALYLEGFLLHYRNLLRFFSGKHNRKDDLCFKKFKVWLPNGHREPTKKELSEYGSTACCLDDDYHEHISKYLQHCTTRRFDVPFTWELKKMCQGDDTKPGLLSLVDGFDKDFLQRKDQGVTVLATRADFTTTMTTRSFTNFRER